MKSFTSILTIVTVFNLLLSGASGFISPASSSPASLTSSLSLKAVPENFSDIAETISDAARSLRGQTVVVKYGGVCEKNIFKILCIHTSSFFDVPVFSRSFVIRIVH